MRNRHSLYTGALRHWKLAILVGAIVITIIWILSIIDVLPDIWGAIAAAIVALLSALPAMLQYLDTLYPRQTQATQPSQAATSDPHNEDSTRQCTLVVVLPEKFRCKSLFTYRGLHDHPPMPERAAIVTEQMINGRRRMAALFTSLEPGNITVFDQDGQLNLKTTLSPGQTIYIDKTRQSRIRSSKKQP